MRVDFKVKIGLMQLMCISSAVQAAMIAEMRQKNLENSSLNATSSKRHGPVVQGFSNTIELEFKENSLYIGNLYAGSDNILTKVIFDTRTKWTGIILDNAQSADFPSDY